MNSKYRPAYLQTHTGLTPPKSKWGTARAANLPARAADSKKQNRAAPICRRQESIENFHAQDPSVTFTFPYNIDTECPPEWDDTEHAVFHRKITKWLSDITVPYGGYNDGEEEEEEERREVTIGGR